MKPYFSQCGSGRSEHVFKTLDRERRRKFSPLTEPLAPFASKQEGEAYLALDPLPCLICGRGFQRLGMHLVKAHDITPAAYREMIGLPVGEWGVDGRGTLATMAESARCAERLKKRSDFASFHRTKGEAPERNERSTRRGVLAADIRKNGNRLSRTRKCFVCGGDFVLKHRNAPHRACSLDCARVLAAATRKQKPRQKHCCRECARQLPSGSSQAIRCTPCNLRYKRSRADASPRWVEAKTLWDNGVSPREIAAAIGVTQSSVYDFARSRGWPQQPDP